MLGLPFVVIALAGFFAGLTVLVAVTLGAATKASRPVERMRRKLAIYTVGAPDDDLAGVPGSRTVLGNSAVARSAVDLTERLVAGRGLDRVMDARLESAGLPLRTAEWMVLHIVACIGGALAFLLLSGGSAPAAGLGLLAGLGGPWAFLLVRQSRRSAAFLAQLPDTLQLLAGGLKAGYSLPQAIDTVVRQGEPPISAEFHRALIEHRLGVPMEDALERVATRLGSDDFSWVVMAVRIQRDVGGNLAELLGTVADTLRERERLRRQVQVLSAEGRLSGIILGALPLGFAAYLLLTRPDYLRPMATPLGVVMVVVAVVLLLVGGFWVSRVIKVDV